MLKVYDTILHSSIINLSTLILVYAMKYQIPFCELVNRDLAYLLISAAVTGLRMNALNPTGRPQEHTITYHNVDVYKLIITSVDITITLT